MESCPSNIFDAHVIGVLIKLRLSLAIKEIKHYKEYKYILINENIHQTVNNLVKIINYNLLIDQNQNKLNNKLKNLIKF